MILFYVLFTVYILAVNFYAFRLTKGQKEEEESGSERRTGDGKLILSALLGGAIAVYASMFAMKYRLSNAVFMILMPILAVLNLYFFYLGFRGIYFLP